MEAREPPLFWSLTPARCQAMFQRSLLPATETNSKLCFYHMENLLIFKKYKRGHFLCWLIKFASQSCCTGRAAVFIHRRLSVDKKDVKLRQNGYSVLCGKCRNQCHEKAGMSTLKLYQATLAYDSPENAWIMQRRSKNNGLPPHQRLQVLWGRRMTLTLCYNSFSHQFENFC